MRKFASVKATINYKLLVYEEDLPIYSYDLVPLAPGHGTTSIVNRKRDHRPARSSSLRSANAYTFPPGGQGVVLPQRLWSAWR